MSNTNPKVTIGVPVYNGEKYLAAALDTLLAQSFEDFELIISDNASTDRTEEIARAYAARDGRVHYERSLTNRGCAWNHNQVFALARGRYFRWAAHDDLSAPTLLARTVELLDERPDVVWCHARSSHIDAAGALLPPPHAQDVSYVTRDMDAVSRESAAPHQRFRAVLLGAGGCLDAFGLMRSEVVRRTGLRLPFYGDDKVFVAELGLHGRYAEIPETLFFVRFTLTRWHLGRGYAAAIARSGLNAVERARCYGILARYFLQVSKWKQIVRGAVSGRGNGGAYLSWVETQGQSGPPCPKPPHATGSTKSVAFGRSPVGGMSHEVFEQSSRT
jgi:glycosyltransferase involved in cell wall biosynthesis